MLCNQEITCNQYSIELDIQVTKIIQVDSDSFHAV